MWWVGTIYEPELRASHQTLALPAPWSWTSQLPEQCRIFYYSSPNRLTVKFSLRKSIWGMSVLVQLPFHLVQFSKWILSKDLQCWGSREVHQSMGHYVPTPTLHHTHVPPESVHLLFTRHLQVGSPDLANKNTACAVEFELQINTHIVF